ncbi:hypothetical protein A2Y83_05335 [Candidatus Falkowbacteria bacterium RBG_13_39_14]|uniref:4Fe-4S ferredoxin-type domain-containing protein n=1 Tax=Candidatus Falkowbacteria bacterium RBG_13_39_14 TaxID=1797985 RepID=A0A1F5S5S7_9BACT|nr:MAG: hypothetical protein A2Y83_05335 [Candidatus Falkowbacteria bacterium RBG_13_39_14]
MKNGKCSGACCSGECDGCIDVCPAGAISKEKGFITVDEAKCIGCGACVSVCEHDAIKIE